MTRHATSRNGKNNSCCCRRRRPLFNHMTLSPDSPPRNERLTENAGTFPLFSSRFTSSNVWPATTTAIEIQPPASRQPQAQRPENPCGDPIWRPANFPTSVYKTDQTASGLHASPLLQVEVRPVPLNAATFALNLPKVRKPKWKLAPSVLLRSCSQNTKKLPEKRPIVSSRVHAQFYQLFVVEKSQKRSVEQRIRYCPFAVLVSGGCLPLGALTM